VPPPQLPELSDEPSFAISLSPRRLDEEDGPEPMPSPPVPMPVPTPRTNANANTRGAAPALPQTPQLPQLPPTPPPPPPQQWRSVTPPTPPRSPSPLAPQVREALTTLDPVRGTAASGQPLWSTVMAAQVKVGPDVTILLTTSFNAL
jgi:hypothetical protein